MRRDYDAWPLAISAELVEIGPHLQAGADADLDRWPVERELLGRLLRCDV